MRWLVCFFGLVVAAALAALVVSCSNGEPKESVPQVTEPEFSVKTPCAEDMEGQLEPELGVESEEWCNLITTQYDFDCLYCWYCEDPGGKTTMFNATFGKRARILSGRATTSSATTTAVRSQEGMVRFGNS
jgi:hypothetical protein